MYRLFTCQRCAHSFQQLLPDVTPAEAARLKADDKDERVMFKCPKCENEMLILKWDLPDLPEPQ